MGRVILVVAFFVLTPVMLLSSLIALISITPSETKAETPLKTAYSSQVGLSVYASLPTNLPSISGFATAGDARNEIVKQYLARYNSPLTPYANEIVEMADKYEIDFRLIPAIAQQESNLCKVIPFDSYNCWGWGITSVSSLGFESFSHGIETVTRGLKKNYIDEGRTTPETIMAKYTPSSNGSWARGVTQFMEEMQ